jgi:hypothetical protein
MQCFMLYCAHDETILAQVHVGDFLSGETHVGGATEKHGNTNENKMEDNEDMPTFW